MPSPYVTISQLGQLSFASLRGSLFQYQLRLGYKSGDVTFAGWQVTLWACEFPWRWGVSRTATPFPFTFTLIYLYSFSVSAELLVHVYSHADKAVYTAMHCTLQWHQNPQSLLWNMHWHVIWHFCYSLLIEQIFIFSFLVEKRYWPITIMFCFLKQSGCLCIPHPLFLPIGRIYHSFESIDFCPWFLQAYGSWP